MTEVNLAAAARVVSFFGQLTLLFEGSAKISYKSVDS